MTVEQTRRFILARVTQVHLPRRDRTSTPDLVATTPTAEVGVGVETAEVVATEVVVAAVISLRAIQLCLGAIRLVHGVEVVPPNHRMQRAGSA
jgi:hypothetical protein